MPKDTATLHVVERARKIIGLTRAELCEQIGISVASLRKIEDGERQRDMSRELAWRIAIETDLSVAEILKGVNGRTIDSMDRPLTSETYDEARNRRAAVPPERVEMYANVLAFRIENILDAAALQSAKLNVTHYALHSVLDDLEGDLGLSDEVLKLKKDYRKLWRSKGIKVLEGEPQHQVSDEKMKSLVSEHRRTLYQERIPAKSARARSSKKTERLPPSRGSDNGGKTS